MAHTKPIMKLFVMLKQTGLERCHRRPPSAFSMAGGVFDDTESEIRDENEYQVSNQTRVNKTNNSIESINNQVRINGSERKKKEKETLE